MPMFKFFNTTALTLFLLLFLISCRNDKKVGLAPGGTQIAQPYKVAPVYYGKATMTYSFPCTIQGEQDVAIIPKVDGFIQRIYVDEGASVKKGQILFQLKNPQYEEAVRSVNAAVKIAEANVLSAKMNVEQVRPLVEKNIISDYALKSNEYALASAEASLASAKADLMNAQVNVGYTTIRSPSDGVVGNIPYKTGSLMNSASGIALTTVYNTANVYAYFSINEKQLLQFSKNRRNSTHKDAMESIPEVSLVLADGATYPLKGKITSYSGAINTQTGSANFRATFPNPNGLIRSGSSANIQIPVTIDTTVVVPQDATFDLQGKKLVYKLGEKGNIISTGIEVNDIAIGNLYIVSEGLKQGDTIVVSGVGSLRPGMQIKPLSVNRDSLYSNVIEKP
ncbi:MAG: efflux RND transporter periplasmic adaptor subunit [Maribacter sp.]|nr:efflux RND transporter periplasmic adaptor subunit [Maribacter sp.]